MKASRFVFLTILLTAGLFLPTHANAQSQNPDGTQPITCSSDDGHRHYCQAETRGGVELTHQRSGSPCTYGSTWGYDNQGIWVDRGCRADFLVRPWNPPSPGNGQAIYCASDDGRRNVCAADTRGGVQLVRQRSGSPCTQGSTWGYDGQGIWVDRGCRADFQVNPWMPPTAASTETVYCASDDGGRRECPVNTEGGAQLVRQRSGSPCTFGRTWGYSDRGIWVDRGCRADFQLGGYGWSSREQSYTIYCASDDGGRNVCETDTEGGVRMVRKRSDADCRYGRSWGYDERGVWVDHGCRADFEIGGGGWAPANGSVSTLTCSSDDMGRHFCQADTRRGVRLIRQRSDADCIYGRTWGMNDQQIWVDRGCRADFELGFRRR